MCFNKCYQLLDCSLQKKDYLQTNTFIANNSRVERNFKYLLIKATKSLDVTAKREILSFINRSISRSHSIVVRDLINFRQQV